MYPETGGFKVGQGLKRLPEAREWEQLERRLEDAMEPLVEKSGLELDQVEFTIEGGTPTVNLYYSTKPQGLRKRRPSELDPMIQGDIARSFGQKLKEALGDLLS